MGRVGRSSVVAARNEREREREGAHKRATRRRRRRKKRRWSPRRSAISDRRVSEPKNRQPEVGFQRHRFLPSARPGTVRPEDGKGPPLSDSSRLVEAPIADERTSQGKIRALRSED